MSVDKWAYDPEICEGRACPGDCDLCDIPKNPEAYEAEEDETTDLASILEHSEIVGYTFKELCMFAEACRRQGIEEDDLKNFCTAAESAAEYTIDKIMEAFEKNALDQLTRATVDDDVMDESEEQQ